MVGFELEKRVAGEMAVQGERGFYRPITVYIPGMDEKAKGGREGRGGEGGLVIGREDLHFERVGIPSHFP